MSDPAWHERAGDAAGVRAMSRFHWAHDIRVGDRVENTQTGERGVTHAIYPADFEDDVEVRLDRGGYATWWGKYVRVISQYTPLQEAR